MNTPPVIIAGGGIAGLSAALALGDREVLVLEKASAFSEVGAGVQIGPNAVRALQKLGAWDAVESITSSPPEIHLRDGTSGQILKRMILGAAFEQRFGAPYRVAHRADLHGALLEVAKSRSNISCKLRSAIEEITVQSDTVSFKADDEWHSTPYLLATDGVQSSIRQSLFAGSTAINSGHVLHRALVDLPVIDGVDLSCVNLWMCPGGHVVHYPAGSKARLNIVAVTTGTVTPQDHFAGMSHSLQQVLNAAKAFFSPWPGFYAPSLPGWTKGGVLLLGDAAHATLPYLAQGAAMALEDAACLAMCLTNTSEMQRAFAETATRRRPRTTRMQQASLAAGRNYHMQGLARHARNAAVRILPTAALQMQLSWIYAEESS